MRVHIIMHSCHTQLNTDMNVFLHKNLQISICCSLFGRENSANEDRLQKNGVCG